MKAAIAILFIFGFTQISYAEQVAQCLGTNVSNDHPVTAKVYLENNTGKILLETTDYQVESATKVDILSESTISIYDNDFVMSFEVSREAPTVPVQAFLQGAFFVEDFYCIYVR